MKKTLFSRVLLASLGTALAWTAGFSGNSQAQTSVCTNLNENWAWDTRAFVASLSPSDAQGISGNITAVDGGQQITATWQCDPSTGMVEIVWSTNITDSLAVDTNALVGANSNGSQIVAIRRADYDTGAVVGGCPAAIVGNWAWDDRAFPATIFSDGTVVGNDNRNLITATWTCLDPADGKIQVDWSTGFIDTLELSSDDNSLVGGNQGRSFSVERRD